VESFSETDDDEVNLVDPDKDIDLGAVTNDDAGAECLHCGGLFFDDSKGQDWIRCIICKKWAHTEYVHSIIEQFVCHFVCQQKISYYRVEYEQ
jgi:hypothetical protein